MKSLFMHKGYFRSLRLRRALILALVLAVQGCAQADIPEPRFANIPAPAQADERAEAVNEKPDSVLYLPLGDDVLMPSIGTDDPLPDVMVGPFELRSETLAGALQLILSDYDVPIAFQTDEGLSRRITVADLHGPLDKVVRQICGLADLYCAYESGILVVKDSQTFTIKIPPISQDTSFMENVAAGLQAIIGTAPIIDKSTRTLVYSATHRNAEMAERYFQRMRSSTALIVFETYIWEVALNAGNSTGVRWDLMAKFGKFASSVTVEGSVGADFSDPISIGLPHTQGAATPDNVFDFLSTFGAVKTISQPQITVLSGSQAKLRAADKQNYVAKVSETIDTGQATTSVDTASVDTGFTITINSAWDNATVYAAIEIALTDVSEIEDFDFSTGNGGATTVQLPKTTEREVNTQVRIRPGDSLLIAGLVRENDNFSSSGPGLMAPTIPTSREVTTSNLELVFLLRPRVIVFTSPEESKYYNTVRGKALPNPAPAPYPIEDPVASYGYEPPALRPEAVSASQPVAGSVPLDILNPAGAADHAAGQ